MLQAYTAGLILYSLLPLDLTLRPGELVHKFRAGRIQIVPFADLRFDLGTCYELLRDVIVFVPVGMALAGVRHLGATARRSWGGAVVAGFLLVGALELRRFSFPAGSRRRAIC